MATNSEPILNWNEVRGNPYLKQLSPVMLWNEDGLTALSEVNHKNDVRTTTPKQLYAIRYGRDYVIAFIIARVINPLCFKDYQGFQSFMDECWNQYQELTGNGESESETSNPYDGNADQVT